MGILSLISNLFGALTKALGLATQRDAEKNTPAQQANAEAGEVQKDKNQAAQDVKPGNLEELRKDVAE